MSSNKRQKIDTVVVPTTTTVTTEEPNTSSSSSPTNDAKHQQANETKTLYEALEIVQSQMVLDLKNKNSKLKQLSSELKWRAAGQRDGSSLSATPPHDGTLEDTILGFQRLMDANSIWMDGRNEGKVMEECSWSEERDEFVYDPHPLGMASRYGTCTGSGGNSGGRDDTTTPLYPAAVRPLGVEALLLVLGSQCMGTSTLQEWRVLEMHNSCLAEKLNNEFLQLELNQLELITGNGESGQHRYFQDASSSSTTTTPSESDKDVYARIEHHLSGLRKEELADYVKVSNLDLRECINQSSTTTNHDSAAAAAAGDDWIDYKYCQHKINECTQVLKSTSLTFLPRTRCIAFDSLLEMENLFLTKKLKGHVLAWKLHFMKEVSYRDECEGYLTVLQEQQQGNNDHDQDSVNE